MWDITSVFLCLKLIDDANACGWQLALVDVRETKATAISLCMMRCCDGALMLARHASFGLSLSAHMTCVDDMYNTCTSVCVWCAGDSLE
eukprot:COSAG06_NODE_3858_length_4826_cov_6.063465_7_plen_89_part_00